jgi:hypothetical protein
MRPPPQPEFFQPGPRAPLSGSGTTPAPRSVDATTLDLLRSWQLEDATNHPAQLKAAEEEVIEFMKAVNEARTSSGEPLVYS